MSDEGSTVAVTARVALPPEASTETARVVRVQVEDVTRADAASTVVAERSIADVALGEDLTVEVPVPAGLVDRRRRYTVRVHVDVSGSGDVSKGDYVSTQSHPVLTGETGDDVAVPVRRV